MEDLNTCPSLFSQSESGSSILISTLLGWRLFWQHLLRMLKLAAGTLSQGLRSCAIKLVLPHLMASFVWAVASLHLPRSVIPKLILVWFSTGPGPRSSSFVAFHLFQGVRIASFSCDNLIFAYVVVLMDNHV